MCVDLFIDENWLGIWSAHGDLIECCVNMLTSLSILASRRLGATGELMWAFTMEIKCIILFN